MVLYISINSTLTKRGLFVVVGDVLKRLVVGDGLGSGALAIKALLSD